MIRRFSLIWQRRSIKREIFLISLTVLFFDQLTKFLILKILSLGQSIPIIKGIFHISLVYNTGIAFGLFKGRVFFFIVIFFLIVAMIVSILKLDAKSSRLKTPLALILGGALGNLVDRLRFGFVVDFLDFRIWPVFNIADSAITIGGIVLFFILLNGNKDKA